MQVITCRLFHPPPTLKSYGSAVPRRVETWPRSIAKSLPPRAQEPQLLPTPRPKRFVSTKRLVPHVPNAPSLAHPQQVQDDVYLYLQFAPEPDPSAPGVRWHFDIQPRLLDGAGARLQTLCDLHLCCVRAQLADTLRQAEAAGLHAEVAVNRDGGVSVDIQGPTPGARLLLDDVMSALTRSIPSYALFCACVAELTQTYQRAEPSCQSLRAKSLATQRAAILKNLILADLRDFARRLGDSVYGVGFMQGNMRPDDVEGVRSCLAGHLQREPYPEGRARYRAREC